ncbi:Spx/MgsR family RNA polymerase-binding regulatory protein [Falsibacillus albus]|uniref:Spx/MgsR family RNA polymerase-binding regulatory protein n=1 Tax=Falsibacillus albus TaxID=2478915 RepID=A0A3L7K595_9BACI|nr:Spx/MgsR family RNA polymerase-binding regulatory protein [Falsibacillus albus]RLQ98243.1 Spx/MgsR family RNA polymerase-binding regulatory protein [Falsibacillus albus]
MEELIFYTYPSCTSCRKAKKWLKANSIEFSERHIFRDPPTLDELMGILSHTTEGLDEILATRSQSYKDLSVDINDLHLSEILQLILDNPKLLRRPILFDGSKILVGYHPEGLRSMTNKKKALQLTS